MERPQLRVESGEGTVKSGESDGGEWRVRVESGESDGGESKSGE